MRNGDITTINLVTISGEDSQASNKAGGDRFLGHDVANDLFNIHTPQSFEREDGQPGPANRVKFLAL